MIVRRDTHLAVSSALALIAFCGLCAAPAPTEFQEREGLRLLFIGNSLTFGNNLPGLVERLLRQAGVEVGKVDSVAFPNFGLQDHWERGPARARIRERRWDVVVLQQGPSATEGRPSLLEYSERFAAEIRTSGASPAMYMVWPAASRSFDFDGVSESYRMAAERVNGLLFPVGEAWRAAWRREPGLPLYGPDSFHPSPIGSYLGALVLFEQIASVEATARSAEDLKPPDGLEISPQMDIVLKDAAREANARFRRVGPPPGRNHRR